MTDFEWDGRKNHENLRKHGFSHARTKTNLEIVVATR